MRSKCDPRGDPSSSSRRSRIRTVPSDLKKKWDVTFKKAAQSAKRWDFDSSAVDFQSVLEDLRSSGSRVLGSLDLELIALHRSTHGAFWPDRFHFVHPITGTEVVKFENILASQVAQSMPDRRSADVPPDEPPERIWGSRLLPFIRVHDSVTVVDPYALTNFFARKRAPIESGLGRFLERAAHDKATLGEIDVITSSRGLKSHELPGAEGMLLSFGKAVGVERVNVHIVNDNVARTFIHGRFILGPFHTIDLDNGLNILSAHRNKVENYSLKRTSEPRALEQLGLRQVLPRMRKVAF